MPRPPKLDSKTVQVVVKARNIEEEKNIRAFKEVCARDGLEMTEQLMKCIVTFLKKHNWPPGNPQKQLPNIIADGSARGPVCFYCKQPATKVFFTEQGKVYGCKIHKPKKRKGWRSL